MRFLTSDGFLSTSRLRAAPFLVGGVCEWSKMGLGIILLVGVALKIADSLLFKTTTILRHKLDLRLDEGSQRNLLLLKSKSKFSPSGYIPFPILFSVWHTNVPSWFDIKTLLLYQYASDTNHLFSYVHTYVPRQGIFVWLAIDRKRNVVRQTK